MLRSLLLLCFSIFLSSCGSEPSSAEMCGLEKNEIDKSYAHADKPWVRIHPRTKFARYETPTELVPEEEVPRFADDLDLNNLMAALERQERQFQRIDLNGSIKLGDDVYPLSRALDTVRAMKRISREHDECRQRHTHGFCERELHDKVVRSFKIYRPHIIEEDPRHGDPEPVLYTGYYTPLLDVTVEPRGDHRHAIYRRPNGEKSRSDRVAIDFRGVLSGQGLESFFGSNLFDLYLAHVQGNAKVRYQVNGEPAHTYLNYDGTNEQRWEFISKYMKEKGMIADGSIQAQRRYLEANPSRAEEIFSTCPSYVYLRTTNEPPRGSGNVPVTGNRTIATDRFYYAFKGLLAFAISKRPEENQSHQLTCGDVKFRDYSRFVIDQDTGGAIRGKGRVDMYYGEGAYAELAASTTVAKGKLYFLISRQ